MCVVLCCVVFRESKGMFLCVYAGLLCVQCSMRHNYGLASVAKLKFNRCFWQAFKHAGLVFIQMVTNERDSFVSCDKY